MPDSPRTDSRRPISQRWLSGSDRVVLGVAGDLAGRTGASPALVRAGFMVLTLALGWGALLYLGLYLGLYGRSAGPARAVTLRSNLGVVVATASQILFVDGLTTVLPTALLWVVGLVVFAVLLADPDLDPDRESRQSAVGRVVAGGALMLGGLTVAVAGSGDLASFWKSIAAGAVLAGGLALVLAPWWQSMLRRADHDRSELIRAEERADVAAHLHDSVLQTLTLIQNRANDPELTAALAHQQERELRRWLYESRGLAEPERDATFRSELEAAAAEVEDQYRKIVECIVVGDASLEPAVASVVAAAREAMVNAAKFAEIAMISVFAEVDEAGIEVFVRDRGVGFEPELVPADRHGVSDSILGRIERLGGEAHVRSEPGKGTEVRIELPR